MMNILPLRLFFLVCCSKKIVLATNKEIKHLSQCDITQRELPQNYKPTLMGYLGRWCDKMNKFSNLLQNLLIMFLNI